MKSGYQGMPSALCSMPIVYFSLRRTPQADDQSGRSAVGGAQMLVVVQIDISNADCLGNRHWRILSRSDILALKEKRL
jgi:hypothetical protein